jgi:hypothetical protein
MLARNRSPNPAADSRHAGSLASGIAIAANGDSAIAANASRGSCAWQLLLLLLLLLAWLLLLLSLLLLLLPPVLGLLLSGCLLLLLLLLLPSCHSCK